MAFGWGDEVEELAELAPGRLVRAFLGFPHEMLELGEDLLDRIEVRAVGRQEEQLGAGSPDGAPDGNALMASEIIHDDDVAGPKRRHEDLLDIGTETVAVYRPIDDAGRIDPVGAERGEEGHRAPVAMWRPLNQPLSAGVPAPQPRHVRLHPGLVDEDQASGIKLCLMRLPAGAPPRDVGSALLGGVQDHALESSSLRGGRSAT